MELGFVHTRAFWVRETKDGQATESIDTHGTRIEFGASMGFEAGISGVDLSLTYLMSCSLDRRPHPRIQIVHWKHRERLPGT